ncbi:MAG: ABC transporter ATP-binding protein, partial [Prochlorococcus sp.]
MAATDIQRLRRLGRYLRQDSRRLWIIISLLVPLALAGAIQPLLVGEAISVLRQESTSPWLSDLSVSSAVRILVGILLLSVLLRLGLQGFQSFNIEALGQRLTARIRNDLFAHSMALSLRF